MMGCAYLLSHTHSFHLVIIARTAPLGNIRTLNERKRNSRVQVNKLYCEKSIWGMKICLKLDMTLPFHPPLLYVIKGMVHGRSFCFIPFISLCLLPQFILIARQLVSQPISLTKTLFCRVIFHTSGQILQCLLPGVSINRSGVSVWTGEHAPRPRVSAVDGCGYTATRHTRVAVAVCVYVSVFQDSGFMRKM